MSGLIERCRVFRESVLADRESLRTENARIETEKQSLAGQITQLIRERTNLSELVGRLQSITYWAELPSGESIKAGDEVRSLGREYRCIKAHTKALLRSPINTEYWESIE